MNVLNRYVFTNDAVFQDLAETLAVDGNKELADFSAVNHPYNARIIKRKTESKYDVSSEQNGAEISEHCEEILKLDWHENEFCSNLQFLKRSGTLGKWEGKAMKSKEIPFQSSMIRNRYLPSRKCLLYIFVTMKNFHMPRENL